MKKGVLLVCVVLIDYRELGKTNEVKLLAIFDMNILISD